MADRLRMVEPCELTGEWWLPSDPDSRIGGILSYRPGFHPRLRLAGSFVPLSKLGQAFSTSVVLGRTAQAGAVTLLDCHDASGGLRNLRPGGGTESFLEAWAVIEGMHYAQGNQVLLSRFTAELSHLDEWANLFKIDFSPPRQRNAPYTILYDHPAEVKGSLGDGSILKIGIELKGPNISRPQRGVHVETTTVLTFEPASPIPLDNALRRLRTLQHLLCLATQEAIFPLRLSGIPSGGKEVEVSDEAKIEVLLYIPNIHEPERELHPPHDMLFVLSDIADDLGCYLDRWFGAAEDLETIFELYFATRYQQRMYLEHRFLSLVQAVEGYHRLRMDRTELPEADHARKVHEVLSSVPPKYCIWLKRVLAHSNEVNLATRLSDMNKRFRVIMQQIDRKKKWISDAAEIRNYLAHGKGGDKPYNTRSLLMITERLRVLTELGLMSELGFSSTELVKLVKRHWRSKPPLLAK